jgi:septum formation protein
VRVDSHRVTLASGSPQRRAILDQLGIAHRVVEPHAEELTEGEPAALVVENALRKALSVARAGGEAGATVLGSDTVVAHSGRVLGKPCDEDEARAMLCDLSGRSHEVHSGIALVGPGGGHRTAAASSTVCFADLGPGRLAWYLASGEWRERAGAYAIQGRGAALIEAIEGDYTTVVGLPVAALLALAPELLHGPPAGD